MLALLEKNRHLPCRIEYFVLELLFRSFISVKADAKSLRLHTLKIIKELLGLSIFLIKIFLNVNVDGWQRFRLFFYGGTAITNFCVSVFETLEGLITLRAERLCDGLVADVTRAERLGFDVVFDFFFLAPIHLIEWLKAFLQFSSF